MQWAMVEQLAEARCIERVIAFRNGEGWSAEVVVANVDRPRSSPDIERARGGVRVWKRVETLVVQLVELGVTIEVRPESEAPTWDVGQVRDHAERIR